MKTTADKEIKRCREIINSIQKAVLITRTTDKSLKGRPMFTAKVDADCNTWFYAQQNDEKLRQISKDNEVLLLYANPLTNSFVIVKGKAAIDRDSERIKEFWSHSIRNWLPHGCDSPDILLLKVIPEEIDYWDGDTNKFSILFSMVSSFAEGEPSKRGHQPNGMGRTK
jgi:general stress protein 26